MKHAFRTLTDGRPIDLIPYISDYLTNRAQVEILIGCDSQNRRTSTVYAVVIGLYTPKKGAHVLYNKFETPRERDSLNRLLKEVWFSVETAEKISAELGIKATWIDIDLNPDPAYKSNQALASAVGVVTGMGYKVRHKGNSPIMTYAADHLVK